MLFDGTTWGYVASIELLTGYIQTALTEGTIQPGETLRIRFREMTDEEVENLADI